MKHVFILTLLVSLVTACVSITPNQISNHNADHSITSQFDSCEAINIVQTLTSSPPLFLNPKSISLLNWNVYKGQGENWLIDFQQLSESKDIITLQEARLDDTLHESLDVLNLYWDITSAFLYKNATVGVLTAAKVPVSNQCSIHTKEPVIQLPKTLMVNFYPILGHDKTLLVANIHSINFTLGIGKYSEQIQKLLSVIQQHNGPVIVAGDFNSWSQHRMDVVEQFKETLSLASLPYQNHHRTRIFGNAIDHIFYRGLVPTRIETPEVTSSDHNPIVVVFSLSPVNEVVLKNE